MPTEISFPVSVEWVGGRRTRAHVAGKPAIDIATPPEFKGVDRGVWSPEDFLVAATASCLVLTLVAVVERRQVPLHAVSVDGVGRMGVVDGRLQFVAIELHVTAETDAGREQDLRAAVERAEAGCFVSMALAIPVELTVEVAERAAA